MTALIPLLILCQALGAIIGAFMAVWGEIAYVRAMRDGKVDVAERSHLMHIGHGLRFGMSLLLLASLVLVIVAYMLQVAPQPGLSTSYWILITLALLTIAVSWALSRGRISFAFGSATIFTSWWFLVYLTFGIFPLLSFGAVAAFFVVATGISYALLTSARFLMLRRN